jgi:hypothetical protein
MKYSIVLFMIMLTCLTVKQSIGQIPADFHNSTEWKFKPSVKYDGLCLINVLMGDPFYVQHYEKDYELFSKKITPEVKASLDKLKQIKENYGFIISAGLCLYYSASTDSTLDQLIHTTRNLSDLKNNFSKTERFNENEWALFESIQEDLRILFIFLKESGFEEYWSEKIRPKIDKRIIELQENIATTNYNLIPVQERLLGFPLKSNMITVYMVNYAQPHGMKITGTKFITDIAYPFNIVLQNAAHEMLHPPYDLANNITLQQSLETLKKDAFLMDKIMNHNPSFGYNSFESYIEENCVRALDQIVSEKNGLSNGPKDRWKIEDEGMHVLANTLYHEMKEEDFNSKGELFSDFLIRMISEGKFEPGKIEARFNSIEP